MGKDSKGFCLFYDWVEVLGDLDPADAMAIIKAVADYKQRGTDPVAAVPKNARAVMRLIYQQIRRSEEVSDARADAARAMHAKRDDDDCRDLHLQKSAKPMQKVADAEQRSATETETTTTTETENNITRSNERVAPAPAREKRFVPPTVDEVREYANANGLRVDAEAFVDHYTGNGWKVGRNAMKDWRAALRNWARRDGEFGRQSPKPKERDPATSSFDTDDFFDAALRRTYADDTPDDPLVGELKARFMTA